MTGDEINKAREWAEKEYDSQKFINHYMKMRIQFNMTHEKAKENTDEYEMYSRSC